MGKICCFGTAPAELGCGLACSRSYEDEWCCLARVAELVAVGNDAAAASAASFAFSASCFSLCFLNRVSAIGRNCFEGTGGALGQRGLDREQVCFGRRTQVQSSLCFWQ